jgi:hypothetical protein
MMILASHVISFGLLRSNHMTGKVVEGRAEMTVRDAKLAMVMKDEMKEWNCLLMFNQIIAEIREHIRS